MKRRAVFMISAALLLTGCIDRPESSAQSDIAAEQTTASASAAASVSSVPSFRQGDASYPSEMTPAPGGVSITNEHAELKEAFGGAYGYCDFEELGAVVTSCSGLAETAREILSESGELNEGLDRIEFRQCIGVDRGCYFFSVLADSSDRRWYYFELDCDSGAVERIYPPEDNDRIELASRDILLCRRGSAYVLFNRHSGELLGLSDHIYSSVYIGDTLYYEEYIADLELSQTDFRICWVSVDGASPMISHSSDIVSKGSPNGLSRGVYNVVYNLNNYAASTLGGREYLIHDPRGRIMDYVRETYYQGTAVTEQSVLGWNTRISITDRENTEHVLGYVLTQERPSLEYNVRFHAADSGLILLDFADIRPIALLADMQGRGGCTAAFLPEGLIPERYSVFCDGERLYIYDEAGTVVTLS